MKRYYRRPEEIDDDWIAERKERIDKLSARLIELEAALGHNTPESYAVELVMSGIWMEDLLGAIEGIDDNALHAMAAIHAKLCHPYNDPWEAANMTLALAAGEG